MACMRTFDVEAARSMFGATRFRQVALDVARIFLGHPPREFSMVAKQRGEPVSRIEASVFVLRRPRCVA
eukprot:11190080-Lingulodinium_polyedra.AAC.1